MDIQIAKKILENEINDQFTNIQKPLDNKYARWKIIDYLWTSFSANISDGECIDWLKNLYLGVGMEDENISVFLHDVELMLETIRRKPLNRS